MCQLVLSQFEFHYKDRLREWRDIDFFTCRSFDARPRLEFRDDKTPGIDRIVIGLDSPTSHEDLHLSVYADHGDAISCLWKYRQQADGQQTLLQ